MQPSQNTRSSKPRYQRLDVTDPDQADMDPSSLQDRITTEQVGNNQRQPKSTNRPNVSGQRMNREGDLEEDPGMDEDEDVHEDAEMGARAGAGAGTGAGQKGVYDFGSKDYDDL
ncbi:hypothetical protein BDW68DRAFT_182480 [Aspergillus falconensis]